MAQAMKRIQKELTQFNKEEPEGLTAGPIDDSNLFKWEATFIGPEESPYEGGNFKVSIEYSSFYPYRAPRVHFLTKVYHPNIKTVTGSISMAILYDSWSPDIDIIKLLRNLQELFIQPEIELSYEHDIAKQYLENRDEYEKIAKEWTEKYANED